MQQKKWHRAQKMKKTKPKKDQNLNYEKRALGALGFDDIADKSDEEIQALFNEVLDGLHLYGKNKNEQ